MASATLSAQAGQVPPHQHATQADSDAGQEPASWQFHLDGVAFGTFNRQGGRRGDTELRSTNWLMAMAARRLGPRRLTLTAMVSGEPFTSGGRGYSQIFQEGEAYRGLQITDHQHPHDLFMRLAAALELPLTDTTTVTFAGGPVGEPSLGPVAFMHRPSSADNPAAPLSHHIFDSTHIASTVFLTRIDRGPIAIEGSIFHGREPDEHHYDIEVGRPDSWAARVWLRPAPQWTIEASHGFLHEPEQLEPGDQRRTNASVSWLVQRDPAFTAITFAVGRNARQYSVVTSWLAEAALRRGRTSLFSRFERTTVETEILLFPTVVHRPHPGELVDPIRALTVGAVRDVAVVRGLTLGVGGDVGVYGVPTLLQVTHGSSPRSFHLFLRVARGALRDRMWNETMGAGRQEGHTHRQSQ